jgi:hypothetical protein
VGSNSIEQLLSEVNWRTDIRFLIRFGETRILLSKNEPGSCVEPVAVTGKREPLPTIMDEGEGYREKEVCERALGSEVI